MTTKQLDAATGGLSRPGKMPCHAWSIPAKACKTGSKLRNIPGSVCSGCYALKNRYLFTNVQTSLENRLAKTANLQAWQAAMVELIRRRETSGFFRWFDSGDLQSVAMLHAINEIALALPTIKFWLPTREIKIVRSFLRAKTPARNLIIRVSATMVDGDAVKLTGCATSRVVSNKAAANCPAYSQGGICGDCRKCWDRRTVVKYPKH